MPTKTLEYPSRAALEAHLPRDVQRVFGNGVYVEEWQETPSALHARLGLELPEIIADPAGDEQVLSVLHLSQVGRLRFRRGDRLRSGPLDRQAFFQAAEARRQDLVRRAEVTMLESAKAEIVTVQPIGSGLNPIRELLVYVHEEDKLDLALIHRGKQKRYLPLLESLGYLRRGRGAIHPGPELQKFVHARKDIDRTPEFYLALLGEVLARGYQDIREGLNVQHLVPIVRAANAYYWPSERMGRPLAFKAADFAVRLRQLHPNYRVDPMKLRNHLVDMAWAGIVEKNGSIYTATPEVWERYTQAMAAR